MESRFSEAVLFIALVLMILILARKVSRESCLLAAILFLPRVVQSMPWGSLVPLQPEDLASHVIKGLLRKIREKLKEEALSHMNQIKMAFSTSTSLKQRPSWSLIFFLLVLLTPVHSAWYGHGAWPKYGLYKVPVEVSPHQRGGTTEDVPLNDQDPLVEALKDPVNDAALESMTNNDTFQFLLQSLELPDSKADNGSRVCLNTSSTSSQGVDLYEISRAQSQKDFYENLNIKVNLSMTLCHNYVLLNFSKENMDSSTKNWLFRFEKEMRKDYKNLVILVLGLYSFLLSYTSICSIFLSLYQRMKRWLGKRKSKAENTDDDENVYEPMNEVRHHDARLLVLPIYDHLPPHGNWPVVKYNALPDPILPIDHLQGDKEEMDHQQILDPSYGRRTRSTDIFPSGSIMSRRSSLLSIHLLFLLLVTGINADQEAGSGFQLYAGDGSGTDTWSNTEDKIYRYISFREYNESQI